MQPPDEDTFLWSTRGLMVVLASSVCGVGYLDRAAAGLLVVPMAEELGWSMEERGRILSAFFTGYICTQVPGGLLAQRLGPRRVLGTALALWSVAAIAAPEAADISPTLLFAALFVMGLVQGPMMPCVAALFASWVPRTERARAVTLTSVGGASGSVSAYYFAPWLAVVAGWRNAWRLFGWIGIGLSVAWFLLAKDSPSTPAASIEEDPAQGPGKAEAKSPLASLTNPKLRSGAAVAAYVAHAGQASAAYTLLLWLPTYLSRSFDMELEDISIYLTLPKVVEMVTAVYAGQFADGLLRRGFTCVQVRQLCTCVSLGISVVMLVLLASARDRLFAGGCICVLFPCMSVCNAGFQAAYLDIGGKDSSLILAFGNMLATLPGIASPIYGAWVLEATGSWHCLFYSVACVQVFAAVFFYKKFGVGQRADFIKV